MHSFEFLQRASLGQNPGSISKEPKPRCQLTSARSCISVVESWVAASLADQGQLFINMPAVLDKDQAVSSAKMRGLFGMAYRAASSSGICSHRRAKNAKIHGYWQLDLEE